MPHIEYTSPDGARWPSVTQVLSLLEKDWKWRWYRGEVKKNGYRGWNKCEAMSNRGMRIGTDFHTLVYNNIVRNAPALGAEEKFEWQSPKRLRKHIQDMASAAWRYTEEMGALPIALEKHLVCTDYAYHGTFDAVMLVGGACEVWDWKTNNQPDKYHAVQLAAYAYAWNKHNPLRHIRNGRVVYVNKKAKTPVVKSRLYTDLAFYFPLFQALREHWDYKNGQGKWDEGD